MGSSLGCCSGGKGQAHPKGQPWAHLWEVTPLFVRDASTHRDAPQLKDNTDELEPVQERATRRGLETTADAERIKELGAADFYTICYLKKKKNQAQVLSTLPRDRVIIGYIQLHIWQ